VWHSVQENRIVIEVLERAHAIATDRDHGASELVAALLPVLQEALAQGPACVADVIRCVCRGQASMAPLWQVCAAALHDREEPGTFERFRRTRARAPASLVRVASHALAEEWSAVERPVVLTLSFSGSVLDVLRAVHRLKPLQVICGEGRPRYEGRRLAAQLAEAGVPVTVTTDASVGRYLADAASVVVGADSVGPSFWINKVGTAALASAAQRTGVPVFVVATTDKSLPSVLASRWRPSSTGPDDIWRNPPPGVHVENYLFEAVPAELLTALLTDVGVLTSADVPAFAERGSRLLEALSTFLA
jgi:translation initiation factor 2B subunit (eIF-2B alpha/beta/delta family)